MNSFQFQNPEILYWILIIPAMVVIFSFYEQRKKHKYSRSIDQPLYRFLAMNASPSKMKIKKVTFFIALFFVILSWARPQQQDGFQKVKNEGIEVVLLVDVSNSMLAEDIQPSRLDVAKSELKKFVDLSSGDRFGLVAFAGSAVLLSPLTSDRNAIKMIIDSLSPQVVLTQGTDFTKGIDEAANVLMRGGLQSDDIAVTRAIVIVSDGEDNEPGALEAAKKVIQKGIHIFTLAVGTEKGGPIPIKNERGETVGYHRDRQGQVVITQSKGQTLQAIAKLGQGTFEYIYLAQQTPQNLKASLNTLQKTEFGAGEIKTYKELYQYFLLVALIFFCVHLTLSEKQERRRIWRGRFEVGER